MYKNKKAICICGVLFCILILNFFVCLRDKKYVSCSSKEKTYYLGGETIGIKLLASSVLVVGVERPDDKIQVGDIILKVNDQEIDTDSKLQEFVRKGEELRFKILRKGEEIETNILPEFNNQNNMYKLGLWVKDSSAGVGTISFYTDDKRFVALGHAITETDENLILPITAGGITKTNIYGIRKGSAKLPGELKGTISNDTIGEIFYNTQNGIFGVMENNEYLDNEKIEIGQKEKITLGDAKIYATIDGESKNEYDIRIDKVYLNASGNKNIAITITDEELIEKTGGIVQGMSGAPIVQDGKLIGVVTHVLLDNPLCGYGTFIENMIEDMEKM